MANSAAEDLRTVNQNLCAGLVRLQSLPNPSTAISAEDFFALRTNLERAASCMCSMSADSRPSAEWEKEISEYRRNLERIVQVLPSFHAGLQAQKGRLEAAINHLQATATWAQASKNSL